MDDQIFFVIEVLVLLFAFKNIKNLNIMLRFQTVDKALLLQGFAIVGTAFLI